MKVIRSYKLKLKPNKFQLQKLNNIFYEAKCLYNYVLSREDIFKFDTKVKNITKLDKDRNKVEIILNNLPAKLRQNIVHRLQDNIKNLSKSKKKGNKIGRLKFKSEINCIDIDSQSFKIYDNKLWILGFKRNYFKCFGLNQLKNIIKTRNAWLIKDSANYYISICCDVEVEEHIKTNKKVGIDMGIKDNIILSNGEKLNLSIGESERIKRLQKKLAKSQKGSKNRFKVKLNLQKAYRKITNQKKDFVNKLVHRLDQEFDLIVWQDELISKWHKGWFGKQVQYSCLGQLKTKLQQRMKEEPNRYIELDSKYPTTKLCPSCGCLNNISLADRIYKCDCGYIMDRDVHSANNMLIFTKNHLNLKVGYELSDFKLVENKTSTSKKSLEISYDSKKQEDTNFKQVSVHIQSRGIKFHGSRI